ncbi:endonuclease Q family protein [Fictibacillus nanhaiensis]|uniref:endonuclease Q family protein n=1 Tax=Fictibacillus nanhaiensis TaxID=742169 RepID=UPI001C95C64D|nr:endonuclease Q family protein [Fictibacillus nanhaiensis]MBY6035615.1 endonuclease Q family protein [Fictibacillus nanhaiensis]
MLKENDTRSFFADMHIHIGASKSGKPIKITGSRSLTLSNILYEAKHIKGMDMIGVIDCHSPEVLEEIKEMVEKGSLTELKGGGLNFEGLTLILGAEIEINDQDCQGPLHVLVYMPDLLNMKTFSKWLSTRMKNIHLSSQRMYGSGKELQMIVKQLGGLFIPAHIFTPFKSLYGKGVQTSLSEVFDPHLIDAVELGLSSDTYMASCLSELSAYPFISNSDAHSLEKIAREYQMLALNNPSFEEFKFALKGRNKRRIVANYGLNPRLGKYYNTACENCLSSFNDRSMKVCEKCGNSRFVMGVSERIKELKNCEADVKNRPPYIHQIPLEFIQGIGPKTLMKLRQAFGTDMNIIHTAPLEKLREIIKPTLVDAISHARSGKLSIQTGGGGSYGKIDTGKPISS